MRLIDAEGEQCGIVETADALSKAEEDGLDLVEIAPHERPPVCRIMDYGKYKYQQKKRSSDARKKGARVELKEIKLRPKTDEHDFMTKLKHARRFLEKNNTVKITIMFRGREITHPEIAREMLARAAVELADVAEVEQSARMEGRNMTMMLNFSSKAKRSDDQADFDDFDDDDGDQD
ncbi:MAG: translation initiation factor IF-3 [Myxococcota bacterium]|nr:translation initiation factor IF-3 [Myxococcota bacterium]